MRPLGIERVHVNTRNVLCVVPRRCESSSFQWVYRAGNFIRWRPERFAFEMEAATLPSVRDQAVAIRWAVESELGFSLVMDAQTEVAESCQPLIDVVRRIFGPPPTSTNG